MENIAPSASQSNSSHLYYTDDETQVELSKAGESSSGVEETTLSGSNHYKPLSTDGIGGLVEQLQALNISMKLVLDQVSPLAQQES